MRTPTFLVPLAARDAGQCELVDADRGAVLASRVEPAFDSKARRKGLLGRASVPDDYAMIIAPCGSVHTVFMRFPIDVVFVSKDGTVVKTCRAVKPWRIAAALRAYATIEAAAGFIDRTETVPGDVVAVREIPHTRLATDMAPPLPVPEAPDGGAPPAGHTTSQRRVTLADIVSRQMPIGWFESVAIVQELCDAVLARGPADDLRVPELKHIVLTPAGGIELHALGPEDHSPVHRAGLVLLALAPEANLPLQLRLLALEAVAPSPRFASLEEFHAELAFFERPDRCDIARGAHGRFLRQQAQTAAGGISPALLEPAPPRRHVRLWKWKWVAGTAALLLALAAAGAAWGWRWPAGGRYTQPASAFIDAAAAMTRQAAAAARIELAVAQEKLGLGAKKTVAPPPVATGAGPEAPAPNEPRAASTAGLPVQTQPAETPAAAGTHSAAPAAGIPDAPDAPRKEPDVLAAAEVFSAEDPLVAPPHLVRPQLPTISRSGARVEDLPELEILVSATGGVENVRLISRGTEPNSAMMLSAVKAWFFQPATRDGQPVRYRLRMRLPGR